MSFKKKRLAIVVLSYNTQELLKNCLKSLIEQRGKLVNPEIIVVDNGSTDGSVEWLKAKGSPAPVGAGQVKLKAVFNDKNLGFCEGNNIGIRYAIAQGYQYIMLLNSDTIVKDRFWEPLISFLEKNEGVGVVTPKIYFAPGFEYQQKRYKKEERGRVIWSVGGEMDWANVIGANRGVDEVDRGQFNQVTEVDFASGCCLVARAELWKQLGFLDEKYFMYYEDADFSQKVKKAGQKIFYLPNSCIYHLNAKSSQVGGSLQDYFISRNRLLFGLRFAPTRTKLALIKESFKLLVKGRMWQKKGVRDFYLRKFGKGSWK